jgi:DNA-binding transcriptional regulator YdaS (Cro superfamily)
MDLLTYIATKEQRAKLAADTGKSPDYLWQVATDRRRASPALAMAIEAATAGKVPKHVLRPDLWAPSKKAA